jgi:hypothetical protein
MLNVMINFDKNSYHSATIARNDGRPSPSRPSPSKCHRLLLSVTFTKKGRHLSVTFEQLHIITVSSMHHQVNPFGAIRNVSALHFITFHTNQHISPHSFTKKFAPSVQQKHLPSLSDVGRCCHLTEQKPNRSCKATLQTN